MRRFPKTKFMDSYGLFFESDLGNRVLMTSDTQFAPYQLTGMYDKSDIIFHDCETSPYRSGVHAHYEDLLTLPEETRAKIYLVHYGDNVDATWMQKAIDDGFKGFLLPETELLI